ncbi:uncharacterized protein LOC117650754 [Thrips palmi]|uniref:Uncharacterized protein LOC117650754 n=1 Tax=Thrips palmi TaxID=161013 RepID=A0A6P8ZXV9_THRPL|nr:uncharacterized protein LOC117650754 [Thrips palmi]
MIEVVVLVEGRVKALKCEPTVLAFRESFVAMCRRDPVFTRRLVTHHPTFYAMHPELNQEVELEDEDTLTAAQPVTVRFATFAARENEATKAPARAPDDEGQEYLSSIGVKVASRSNASARCSGGSSSAASSSSKSIVLSHRNGPGSAASSSTTSSTTKGTTARENTTNDVTTATTKKKAGTISKSRKRPASDLESSDDDNDYLREAEERRKSNMAVLEDMNFIPKNKPRLPPKKKLPAKDPPGDNQLRRSERLQTVQCAKASENLDESILSDEENDKENDSTDAGLFDSTTGNPKESSTKQAVKRRKPNKKLRSIGQRITIYKLLPPFPPKLVESFEKGLVYRKQTHTQRMNEFLKAHILNVTKDLYPYKSEYKVLEIQVLARLKSMKIPGLKFYKGHIRRSLSASIRNDRNWEQNKKERYEAARELIQMAKDAERRAESSQRVIDAYQADYILRQPVRNKDESKRALDAMTVVTSDSIQKMPVKSAIDLYQYLKHPDLLMYDFSRRIESTLEKLEENFEHSMAPLAIILSVDESPQNELDKAQLLQKIENYFEVSDENFPCIQFCDASIDTTEIFNKVPKGLAPALIAVQNDEELVSAIIVFNGETLCSMVKPRAFDCVALLLSVYAVFNIDFPKVYEKQLLTLHHILNGDDRLNKIPKIVKTFFKKLFEAMK